MKLYIDTNVYLDYFLDRKKSEYAFRLFKKSLACRFHIIISDQVLAELYRQIEYSEIKFLFELLKHKMIFVKSEISDEIYAKTIPTHFEDALHIALAKKSGADTIVTNNTKDFCLIFKTNSPEDL